jgi:GNAT superfamily N-acetyltransferase
MARATDKAFEFDLDETAARARSWLLAGHYTVLLAHAGGDAVGFLSLAQTYALYTEGRFGIIPECFVKPAYRSRGIGAGLLDEAKRLARSRGWRRLEVTTPPLPEFAATLAFYERHGFRVSGGRKMRCVF